LLKKITVVYIPLAALPAQVRWVWSQPYGTPLRFKAKIFQKLIYKNKSETIFTGLNVA